MKYYLSLILAILFISPTHAKSIEKITNTAPTNLVQLDQILPNKLYTFDVTNRSFTESQRIESNGYATDIDLSYNLEMFNDILKANTPVRIELTQQKMLIQNLNKSSYRYDIMWEEDNIFVKNELTSKWDYFGFLKDDSINFQVVFYKRSRPASTIKRPVVILGADYFLEEIGDITQQDDIENNVVSHWLKMNIKASLAQ